MPFKFGKRRRTGKFVYHLFSSRKLTSLIRPVLEYSCSVWHPHKKSNKDKIEKVQRRAARLFQTILGVKQVSQKCYTI